MAKYILASIMTGFLSAGVAVLGQIAPSNDAAAIQALQSGQFEKAIEMADAALTQDAHDCRMLTIRALALRNSGKRAEGLQSFKLATSVCPSFLPALKGLAETQYAEHSSDAPATLERILELDPDNETSHAMLAVLYARSGDCSAAISHFSKAQKLVASNPAAMSQFGSCLIATGDSERAKPILETVLEKRNSRGDRLLYAYACWQAKDYTAASAALNPLLQSPTPDPEAMSLAARIAESSGDTPRAVALLQQAITAKPDDAQNYLIFAEISFNHASYKVGVDMLNAGLQRLPQNARLYVARGVLEVQQGALEDAMTDFRKAHQLDPSQSLAGDAIGIMLDQRHQTADSLAAYAQQARAHPDDALVQYLYAEALSQSSAEGSVPNDTAALAAARRAVKLEPDYQPALDLLCQLEFRAGNINASLEIAQKAIARNPEDETAIYQEMMAYRRLGKKHEVDELVAKMKQVKEHQRDARTNYQLQEVTSPE
ncbi:TPR domain protein, putative component of TonB system [Acidisarcina polymorpha]|uniref:TPR domain protein, putative component of TonB system n=1 Tax=Acidisarcina polymorpha TaxID=2211140 RepID=A0A2Z5FTU0_9BACT|nr:TPR domain protein, putative component of TonB system [Acidisarcina polymorpha]